MRKLLRIYLGTSSAVWIVILAASVLNNTWIKIISVVICILYVLFGMFFFANMDSTGFSRFYYSKLSDLMDIAEKNYKQWEKAKKLINILGEHESIKLWNKNKDKTKDL